MKNRLNPLIVIILWLISPFFAQAQQALIHLRSGDISPKPNISASAIRGINESAGRQLRQDFLIIQFDHVPGQAEKAILEKAGIRLLDYVPDNAYTVSVRQSLDWQLLQRLHARAVVSLTPEQKMARVLSEGNIPGWAIKMGGTVDVLISFPATVSAAQITLELNARHFAIVNSELTQYRIITVRLAQHRLRELAGLPIVEFIEPVPHEDQPLNYDNRMNSRADILQSTGTGGFGLTGKGISIGIGDNSDAHSHVDFGDRVYNLAATPPAYHGSHVHGTVAGAGLRNERYKGFAPEAKVISQLFSNIFIYADAYVADFNMTLTNNSYGAIIGDCGYNGLYDLYSRILDQQAFQFPKLQHVFAAGNSGDLSCSPFPQGFQTVLGSYQSAKNTLSVGNTYKLIGNGEYSTSSRGPLQDGRIKPEISAAGTLTTSTITNNGYGSSTGTSMAAPAVTGGLALLAERYKQLHGNNDPSNQLLKAVICNGATDVGNPGPDYTFGFGWMNLLRSVEMINQDHIYESQLVNGGSENFTISVPPGSALLKVMLYWNDPAAASLASQALVNDLDLTVTNPGGSTILPYILNPDPLGVTGNATQGVDRVNNIEQVVIDMPTAGSYSLNVMATRVAENPNQPYVLVYDIVPEATLLTYPSGNLPVVPKGAEVIQWDAYGNNNNSFTLEYSLNDGSTWTTINTNVPGDARQYNWTVPDSVSTAARVRIQRNGTAQVSTSEPFVILANPAISLNSVQCEGYISAKWTAVSGADDYEVMMVQGNEVVPVGTTTALTYNIGGLSKDSVYWVTVRARKNGRVGLRAQAISRQPSTGTCVGTISNGDLKLDSVYSPLSGRLYTSTALTAATPVTIQIKNLDDAAVNSYQAAYRINGGAWVTENVTTAIPAKSAITFSFATKANLLAVGTYQIDIAVTNTASADAVTKNDSLHLLIRQLDNAPVDVSLPYFENFESVPIQTINRSMVGLSGADRYDFTPGTATGRLRTFVSSGIAWSGQKAITLDADRYFAAGNINYLLGTFNLAAYDPAMQDLRLDFRLNNHGQLPNAANRVWLRGTDMDPWIEVANLDTEQDDPGVYKLSKSIELSDALLQSGQIFSTSSQLRWGQWGQILASDPESGAGYTFDDIRIYQVFNDLQMKRIDTPLVASCALGSAVPVRVVVRNSANVGFSDIPVRYRIDGGSWVTETIPLINGKDSVSYTFSTTADLSTMGEHTLETIVDYPGDSFRENDTLTRVFVNSPVIASFPYLEDFETGNGNWYPRGKHSSWEYGTPASQKVNKAASGLKAWKTRLSGNYNDNEYSYLYSPCFDVSALTQPVISFMLALDFEDCGSTTCDAAWIEYSADGISWQKLGSVGAGTNWYNKPDQLWSIEGYTRWHVATIPLPAGYTNLRLRFVVHSDPFVNKEGIAIDDIHIYEAEGGLYDGPTASAGTQTVQSPDQTDFLVGGKKLLSILPKSASFGNTAADVFVSQTGVRHYGNQYYHNRSFTIIPTNTSTNDSALVRLYFPDSETDSLLFASGCSSCSKPTDVTGLGVSQYSDADKQYENGSIQDNIQGTWIYHEPGFVKLVPYDKGYYAEFEVNGFSEFWLNDGGPDQNHALPVRLTDFTVQKFGAADAVRAAWTVGSEEDVDGYEIQIAKGYEGLQQNQFVTIGRVQSQGNTNTSLDYSFMDTESPKSGVRYYRLKVVNTDGSFAYSATRSVYFSNDLIWKLYPNPSTGQTFLFFLAAPNDKVKLSILDANGRLLKTMQPVGSGVAQKYPINLETGAYPAGAYLIRAEYNGQLFLFRYYKQ